MIKSNVTKSLVALAALAAIGAGAGITAIASADTTNTTATTQTTTPPKDWHKGPGMGMRGHGVMGTVTAVNGNTLTITNTDGTTYTVDATNAQMSKTVTITTSDIKVGDTLGVVGTVTGTSVAAVHIMDGIPPKPQAPPTTTTQ